MKNINHSILVQLFKGSSQFFSTKKTIPAGLVKIRELIIINSSNINLINQRVFHLITDIDVLIAAYAEIKSNPGNMTPGSDNLTLDGVSLDFFHELIKALRTGTFKFQPSRRINIPKVNSTEIRPLSVCSPRDKIVQKAIEIVLNSVFEPSFKDASHGFRANRGCHTALRRIKLAFHAN